MLIALIAAGLTMAVAAPLILDAVLANDPDDALEEEPGETKAPAPETDTTPEDEGADILDFVAAEADVPPSGDSLNEIPPQDPSEADDSAGSGGGSDDADGADVPLSPVDPEAPDVPAGTNDDGAIGPADPDAPDDPAGTDDLSGLAPTPGDAPEAPPDTKVIEVTVWNVPITDDAEPAKVASFDAGNDVLAVVLPDAPASSPGSVDVIQHGADSWVMIDGQSVAVLQGGGDATLSDLRLLSKSDPLARLLG